MVDLFTVLNRLGNTFLPMVYLLFGLMGVLGTWIGLKTFHHAWLHATGEMRPNMISKEMLLAGLALAGALIVPGVIMWKAAGTFVLGGNKTYDMFSYLSAPQTSGYCETSTNTLTKFFMVLGVVSMIVAAQNTWGKVQGDSNSHNATKAWVFFVGGLLLFFVNDVAEIASRTTGIPIGLPQICAALTP